MHNSNNNDTFYKYIYYDFSELSPIWECHWCGSHHLIWENEYNYCPVCGCKIQAWKGEEEYWNKTKETK